MMLPVVHPDVQLMVVSHLRPLLASAGAETHVKVPGVRPVTFVTVRRSGGTAAGILDRPLVDVFAWAGTDEDAHDLAQLARGHLANLPASDGRARHLEEYAGLSPAPDPSNAPRWTFTVEITTRGERL